LPLRNENGKELPVSTDISGGFNEALGFFRKKKKIVRPTTSGKATDGAESRIKRPVTQFE
jgi:hypothetical protein